MGGGKGTGKRGYAALLRGVSPMNARMPVLKRCFEAAGFTDVKTVIGSGNVVFSAAATSEGALQRRAEKAMQEGMGRSFLTIVRPLDDLDALLAADPYAAFRLAAGSKKVVTFLRDPPQTKLALPKTVDGARILLLKDRAVFTAYVPSPRGAVFMRLIEETFGTAITTRTWDTLMKVARARPGLAPVAKSRAKTRS